MTKLEAAKKILDQGHCSGVYCEFCPAREDYCMARLFNIEGPVKAYGGLNNTGIRFFKNYIKEHDVADKEKAIARLDAIEKEAAELRKIIEKPVLAYDSSKVYIGVNNGKPYIMAGYEGAGYFRFHAYERYSTEQGYDNPQKTGQECLDYHKKEGFDIREFSNAENALEYFLYVLRANK